MPACNIEKLRGAWGEVVWQARHFMQDARSWPARLATDEAVKLVKLNYFIIIMVDLT